MADSFELGQEEHKKKENFSKNGDECIGKMLTVRYQELTDDGVPRFPVGIAIETTNEPKGYLDEEKNLNRNFDETSMTHESW